MQTKKRLPILRSGITLIEVLIAIFVVGIGLLGVLAVIPFGALQVSKENHARYASNMLANATEEILIRNMINPERWVASDVIKLESGGEVVFERVTVTVTERGTGMRRKTEVSPPDPPDVDTSNIQTQQRRSSIIPMLNCTKFIWYEPFDVADPKQHIFCISTFKTKEEWNEVMRGQDDLNYTAYADKRPDFANKQGKIQIQSSGKYTWFFTYLPRSQQVQNSIYDLPKREEAEYLFSSPDTRTRIQVALEIRVLMSTDPNITLPTMPLASFPPEPLKDRMPLGPVPLYLGPSYVDEDYPLHFSIPTWYSGFYFTDAVAPAIDVDVLACYNRVPSEDQQVQCTFTSSRGGGSFTSPDLARHLGLLAQTKYVFATWGTPATPEQVEDGVWCKVVFVDKSNSANPKIIVTTVTDKAIPNTPNGVQLYIPSGVLYHKRLEGVPMREE